MGQAGSFAQVPPVTLPATGDVSGLSLALLHNTLTQRLPGAGLPPGEEPMLRRGAGCWQTQGQGGACPGPGTQQGADKGTEQNSRAYWFWVQGESSITVSASTPGHQPLMPCHSTSYGTSFFS